MSWRAGIMALPEHDRLPAALDMIRDLMGGGTAENYHWKIVLGVPHAAAIVFGTLLARPGLITPRETMCGALEFSGRLGEGKVVEVYICRLRKALGRIGYQNPIETVFGTGYILDRNCAEDILERHAPKFIPPRPTLADLPEVPLERRGLPWGTQDDQDLRQMVLRGDEVRFIAYELQRTERAVIMRCDKLRLRRKLRVGPTQYPSRLPWDDQATSHRQTAYAAG